MFANDFLVPSGQAASPSEQADPDNDNLPDILVRILRADSSSNSSRTQLLKLESDSSSNLKSYYKTQLGPDLKRSCA